MGIADQIRSWMGDRLVYVGRRPTTPAKAALKGPAWAQANPLRIERALRRALERPSGGWLVVDASRVFGDEARSYVIDGRRLVFWRDERGALLAAPEECPHMGASLANADVREGRLICPWHGLALGREGHGRWRPYPVHDDGVLVWVRTGNPDEADLTDAPILPARPDDHIAAIVRMEAECDPADVIANRLDPWHGDWFHPYSFADLTVTHVDDDLLRLRVAYRVMGPVCVEVDATFHSPEPNSIVMTIVDGDGVGSVVETHATPTTEGRTAVVEATLATSDRRGFQLVKRARGITRWFMERSAKKLWEDDVRYAERRALLRREAGEKDVAHQRFEFGPRRRSG